MRNPLVAAAGALLLALAAVAPGRADPIVTLTRVGNPTWAPVDFHLFTAPGQPFGTTGVATASAVLAPHFRISGGIVIPVPPDPGPYTNELATSLARLGIPDTSTFRPADIAGTPNSVWLAYMFVPSPGTTGSSPDFASGPIIPESLFPIVATIEALRNGSHFDTTVIRTRKLADLPVTPPFNVDGSSHRPQLLAEDLVGADNPLGLTEADVAGQFEFVGHIRDAQGNGFDFVIPFEVVPEPSSLALLGLGGLALAGWRRWRKAARA